MNKKTKKSDKGGLAFKRETIRSLTDAEIGVVAGGMRCAADSCQGDTCANSVCTITYDITL